MDTAAPQLRVRVRLTRASRGTPLQELVHLVAQTSRFFEMLAEDVRVHAGAGRWMGLDFEPDGLGFTTYHSGPVTAEQIRAFQAAFQPTGSLRPETLAQRSRLAQVLGEGESLLFGLFGPEPSDAPVEWRVLSRENRMNPSMPPASIPPDQGMREEPAGGPRVKELRQLRELGRRTLMLEDGFRDLLSTVETYLREAAARDTAIAEQLAGIRAYRKPAVLAGIGLLVIVVAAGFLLIDRGPEPPPFEPETVSQPPAGTAQAVAPIPQPQEEAPTAQAAPRLVPVEVRMEASEATWITLTDASGAKVLNQLLQPGAALSVTVADESRLRVGNAGGLNVQLGGKSIGRLGPVGGVREIAIAPDGSFRFVPVQ